MISWVLILTLVTWDGVAVQTVPGFNSSAACVAAGNAWLKALPDPFGGQMRDRLALKSAVCVGRA